jgi:hypothetical protein
MRLPCVSRPLNLWTRSTAHHIREAFSMQAWWIPNQCNDLLNDSIHFDSDLDFLMVMCRRSSSFSSNKRTKFEIGRCEQCGEISKLSVHHIRPLWSLAIDVLCHGFLTGNRINILRFDPRIYENWNAINNLMLLCFKCHNRIEIESDKTWRRTMLDKYHPNLCYFYRDAKKNYARYWNK